MFGLPRVTSCIGDRNPDIRIRIVPHINSVASQVWCGGEDRERAYADIFQHLVEAHLRRHPPRAINFKVLARDTINVAKLLEMDSLTYVAKLLEMDSLTYITSPFSLDHRIVALGATL